MNSLQNVALSSIDEAASAILALKKSDSLCFLEQLALCLVQTFSSNRKVLIAGNGGSLCDASHFAEELTGYFRTKRKAFPVLVLSEPGHVTCVGNDVGFEHVFRRGIEAFGTAGDLFIALSTSGNSKNLVLALEEAKKRSLRTAAFLGKDGGAMKGMADLELCISGFTFSDRIQEAHMAALHIAIELFEKQMGF